MKNPVRVTAVVLSLGILAGIGCTPSPPPPLAFDLEVDTSADVTANPSANGVWEFVWATQSADDIGSLAFSPQPGMWCATSSTCISGPMAWSDLPAYQSWYVDKVAVHPNPGPQSAVGVAIHVPARGSLSLHWEVDNITAGGGGIEVIVRAKPAGSSTWSDIAPWTAELHGGGPLVGDAQFGVEVGDTILLAVGQGSDPNYDTTAVRMSATLRR